MRARMFARTRRARVYTHACPASKLLAGGCCWSRITHKFSSTHACLHAPWRSLTTEIYIEVIPRTQEFPTSAMRGVVVSEYMCVQMWSDKTNRQEPDGTCFRDRLYSYRKLRTISLTLIATQFLQEFLCENEFSINNSSVLYQIKFAIMRNFSYQILK